MRLRFLLQRLVHDDAAEHSGQAGGDIDRAVHARPVGIALAVGLVEAVEDVALEDALLSIAVH